MDLWGTMTLTRRYLLVSFLVMLAAMIIIGFAISRQIETAVASRTAALTALYVDSYISRYMTTDENGVTRVNETFMGNLLTDTSFGRQIVSIKVWLPDGRVIYSSDERLVDQQFAIQGGLAQALEGSVVTEVSDLDSPEQALERENFERLIETYAPVRAADGDEIIAVTEFYQTAEALDAAIEAAQIQSWLVLAAVMATVYLVLAGLVRQASNTIVRQRNALQDTIARQDDLLDQNRELHGRVRRAASRTTALNERYLRRIAADLHDGPAQDLALALLRLESLAGACTNDAAAARDYETVKVAAGSALDELRAISAGLHLPAIETLSPADTARRAVRDFEQKSGGSVELTLGELPAAAPFPVRITLYRVLNEALANAFRHAGGAGLQVRVGYADGALNLSVRDRGPGFDPESAQGNGHLGLTGMRERVELLGGRFEIRSTPEEGTTLDAVLPLQELSEKDS